VLCLVRYMAHVGVADLLLAIIPEVYPTEGWDVAWNPSEMGSTRVGGMREGPAPQAENKISS
jgi:hypothetical protein